MKNNRFSACALFFALLCCSCLCLFTLSCKNIGEEGCRLSISCAEGARNRTIEPSQGFDIRRIGIEGRGPEGASFSLDAQGSALSVRVNPGEWTLLASAFNDAGIIILEGRATLTILPGIDSSAHILLSPRAGTGTIGFNLIMPSTLPPESRFRAEIRSPATSRTIDREAASEAFSIDLETGYYELSYQLCFPDGKAVGGAETLRIMADLSSILSIDFASQGGEAGIGIILDPRPALVPRIELSRIRIRGLPLFARCRLNEGPSPARWFLNGAFEAEGDDFRIEGSQNQERSLRIDALCSNQWGTQAGSASIQVELRDEEFAAGYCRADILHPQATPGLGSGDELNLAALSRDTGFIALSSQTSAASSIALYAPQGRDPALAQTGSGELRVSGSRRRATSIRFSPDGAYLAAINQASNWLVLLSISAQGAVISSKAYLPASLGLPESSSIVGVDFSSDSKRIYLLEGTSRGIHAYNLPLLWAEGSGLPLWSQNALTGSSSSSPALSELKALPDGDLYARSEGGDSILRIRDSGAAPSIIQTMNRASGGSSFDGPADICVDTERNLLYVACSSSSSIMEWRLDAQGIFQLSRSLTAAQEPRLAGLTRIEVDAESGRIILPLPLISSIAFIDPGQSSLFIEAILLPRSGSYAPAQSGTVLATCKTLIVTGCEAFGASEIQRGALILMRAGL